ncbi:UFSP1 [Bugula neritina]|uniref:UFSP1 n=1 Tax=Bugula neritina TaxID=10212 RepID=A0A7J7KNU2_BUGNE|nr:UFSP1 [Bugula neritina]
MGAGTATFLRCLKSSLSLRNLFGGGPQTIGRRPQPAKPDPRLQINNPKCGETYRKEVSSPQFNIATVPKQNSECQAAALEVTVSPPTSKSQLLTERLSSLHSESLLVSSIHLEPKTENPCYLMDNEKFEDVHEGLDPPPNCDEIIVSSGYEYYHYNCDGVDDRGWGCGYRTLQTVCSWISSKAVSQPVPSLHQIQEILVAIGDKEKGFIGSKEWIGSVEVGLVIDKLYDIPCKILHVSNGYQFNSHIQEIRNHFLSNQSVLMMGGESDTSSKGIVGLATSCLTSDSYLLVLVREFSPLPFISFHSLFVF